jgi:UDP-N-acetylglucosamine acyltransferase
MGDRIHPTAIIHPKAEISPTAKIGPYAIIDEGVQIGPRCVIGPHVYVTGQTRIGAHNQFFAGCVIGEAPQDLKYGGAPTEARIGDHNVFREYVTVHRSAKAGEATEIGSHNFLMAHSHVGHNCLVGDYVIMANGALLGGHASVADRAFISGNCLVHQFTRVGTLAIMQGSSAISKDLPPFTVARGRNGICGLNIVGLRRAGFTPGERQELKQLYRALFRSGVNLREAVEAGRKSFSSAPARQMLDFLAASKRGVCFDTGAGPDSEAD